MDINRTISNQQQKVNQLAHEVHKAKVELTNLEYAGGWDKYPEWVPDVLRARRNPKTTQYTRSDGTRSIKWERNKQVERLEIRYREARAAWMVAKTELDSLRSRRPQSAAIAEARARMAARATDKLNHAANTSQSFELDKDPQLKREVKKAIDESVQQARQYPTRTNLLVVVSNLASGQKLGAGTGMTGPAMDAAKQIAKKGLEDASRKAQANPGDKKLQDEALQWEEFNQWLGN